MRHALLAVALVGCGSTPAMTTDGGGGDMAGSCHLLVGVTAPAAAKPGEKLMVSVTPDPAAAPFTARWSASGGTLAPSTGNATQWTIDPMLAKDRPAKAMLTVVASAAGCPDQMLSVTVDVDWPPGDRTLVIYNPTQTGSQDVAQHYADFRKIAPDHLCPVDYADAVVVQQTDFAAWLAKAMACVDKIGPHVHYLVPTWGVPYKLAGQVHDSFQPMKPLATVSLDAVLVYGHDAAKITAPVYMNDLYQPGDSLNGTYGSYVPFGDYKSTIDTDYFLVARIDGADAAAAKALVDRTAAADAAAKLGKLAGTVYVDGNRGLPHPATDVFGSYESGEWNIIGVETVFKAYGKYPIVTDWNMAEFGTAPAPLAAPNALYYAGWYSYGHYNDVFTWNVGAIGAHLDSCSACDIRAGGDWSAVALQRGITATFGAVSEPYVAGLPCYDQFFKYLTDGASFGEAGYESNPVGAWMVVWVGDPLYRPYAK